MHQNIAPQWPMSAFAHSTTHRCTRFCHFEHAFGNLYICQTSGYQHVCDSTCDQGVYYDGSHVICRLSKVIRPTQQCEQLDR